MARTNVRNSGHDPGARSRRTGLSARPHVRNAVVFLAPVPALMVGVSIMRGGGVSAGTWLLNVAAWVVGISVAGAAFTGCRPAGPRPRSLRWFLLVGLALLAATLLAPGMEGVHRWLSLGPVRIHVGALLLPPMLVALGEASWVTSVRVAFATLTVLTLQPDAAQAASFCAAWISLTAARGEQKAKVVMGISVVMALACLLRPDPLEAVPHVEGILAMAASQGAVVAGAGLVSLAALPLSFAVFLDRPQGTALAVYMAGTLIAAWLGNYPVPILGYGVSPILGYYGAVAMAGLRRGIMVPFQNGQAL